MTSVFSLGPSDWVNESTTNSGAPGFRSSSARFSPPGASGRGAASQNNTTSLSSHQTSTAWTTSPMPDWRKARKESTSAKGTSSFSGPSARASYIPVSYSPNGSLAPMEDPRKGVSGHTSCFAGNATRDSYITAQKFVPSSTSLSGSARHPQSDGHGSRTVQPTPRGAPLSTAPLPDWVKGRRQPSAAFADSTTRHSYVARSSTTTGSTTPLDDWGRSKNRGRSSSGMLPGGSRDSYVPKSWRK